MSKTNSIAAIAVAMALMASGCGQGTQHDSNTAVASGIDPAMGTEDDTPPAPISRADAQMPDGEHIDGLVIDFTFPQLNEGVAATLGLGDHEAWGRWSTDKLVTIKLDNDVPASLTLSVSGMAYGPNLGSPVKVTIGDESREITFDSSANETHEVVFSNASGNSIVFEIPQPTSPGANDPRTLGIGLTEVRLQY